MQVKELRWVDGFLKKIKPHIYLRAEDKVLILPPNKVYKVNDTGYYLLTHLLQGGKIRTFPGLAAGQRAKEVHEFFCDLHAFYLGCPGDPDARTATERCTYDFHFTRLPILGELAVTYRCNNACLFCYAHSTAAATCSANPVCTSQATANAARPSRREMSLAEAQAVIRIFREQAKIPFFSFTGGEPLLRDDLEQMMAYAVKQGLQINLITNGTLVTPRRAKHLYKSGLRTAQVSLESRSEELHDYLTNTPGSFYRTIQGIKALQNAGIAVQTNTTLNSQNAALLPDFPAFLKGLGIMRFSVNLFIPVGRGLINEQLFFPYAAVAEVIEGVRAAAANNRQTFFWYSPLPYCYYNPVAHGLGNKSCAAMDGLLSVSPVGDILPCSSYPQPMGNLLQEDFKSIWFSRQALFFKHKQYAPAECQGCDKFTACQSACPLYWAYAGKDELKKAGAPFCAAGRLSAVYQEKEVDINETIREGLNT